MGMFNVRSRMFRPTGAPVNQAYGSLVPTYIVLKKFDTTCFFPILKTHELQHSGTTAAIFVIF